MKNIISRTLSSLLKAESILIALEAYTSRPNPDNEVITHLAFSIDDHLGIAKDITVKLINDINDISTSLRFESIISKSSQPLIPPANEYVIKEDPSPKSTIETVAPQNSFATRLRLALAHSGMNQTELAEELGVSQSTVSNIVNDKREPSITLTHRMAHELGVNVRWLLYGEGEMQPAKFLTHNDEV